MLGKFLLNYASKDLSFRHKWLEFRKIPLFLVTLVGYKTPEFIHFKPFATKNEIDQTFEAFEEKPTSLFREHVVCYSVRRDTTQTERGSQLGKSMLRLPCKKHNARPPRTRLSKGLVRVWRDLVMACCWQRGDTRPILSTVYMRFLQRNSSRTILVSPLLSAIAWMSLPKHRNAITSRESETTARDCWHLYSNQNM